MMCFAVTELLVESMDKPLGLDEKVPRFSWKLSSDKKNTQQTSCQIIVTKEGGEEICWDSGKMSVRESRGIAYHGKELEPCTRYEVYTEIYDNFGRKAEARTWFETGFLDGSPVPWEGARWISAPEFYVAADTRGVFVIESCFCLKEGAKRGGVVFGSNDFRLLDKNKNEFGLEGENYLRYEICLEDSENPRLDIYRVGYAKEDRKDIPFASAPLVNFEGEEKRPIVTAENRYDFHTLKVVVDGNNSFTYLDDILVDAVEKEEFYGTQIVSRTLNPRGFNDVLTYPRLNEIGFFAGAGDTVYFRDLTVKNLRAPGRTFIRETPQGNLYGRKTIFEGKVPVENGCFKLESSQITCNPSHSAIPMLRTVFQVKKDKKMTKARLYITSRGIYDCRINGQEITERLLTPGLTQYDKRMNYQTYDITDKLQPGKNGVGVTLSSGWWSDAQTFVVKNYNYFGDKEALLAKVEVLYEDGSRTLVTTNTDEWRYFGDGPYRYAGFFLGEQFDARKADIYEQYSLPEYDAQNWEIPVEERTERIEELRTMPPGFGRAWPAVNEGQPELVGEYDAPVYVVEERAAKKRRNLAENIWLYDLEQEMAGVPRIRFREKPGTRIILRYAEVLYPDMPEYAGNQGKMMLENYRDATSTDIYVCRGDEDGEIYQPRFTFHGYRYIEISGAENPPEPEEVKSLQYSSIPNFEGSFSSSNSLLNRFTENVRWSQMCNFINIPTDCPQRNERMGWAGDTHVFCHTALQNSDLKQFYVRYLQAMADLQTEEGQYPEIAPVGGGFGGITYECATIFMAWELYQQYSDKRILERFYPGMKKYMVYMKDKGLPGEGDIAKVGPLGDWLAPEETDLQLLWNVFYYREAILMEKISRILGHIPAAEEYALLAEQCKSYWNETFVDPHTKRTRAMDGSLCDSQCSYVLGLEYGIMEDTDAARRHLLRKTREQNHTVGTGFFGTGLLNQALSNMGADQDACKLMLQTDFPSWLYPVTQGATTIWEHWDSFTKEKGFGGQNAMNSFNHYSLGSVLSWLYSYVLGIRREEEYPGYEHFLLEPVTEGLDYACGSVASPYGTIRSSWRKEGDTLYYHCEIPVNTRASLILPGMPIEELGSGVYDMECHKTDKGSHKKRSRKEGEMLFLKK